MYVDVTNAVTTMQNQPLILVTSNMVCLNSHYSVKVVHSRYLYDELWRIWWIILPKQVSSYYFTKLWSISVC